MDNGGPRKYRFSIFEIDLDSQELRKHGVRLRCGGQPFRILQYMVENAGSVVSRDRLQVLLWPEEQFGDHDQRLNKAINKVREALGDSPDVPRFVETLPRVGYRFICPVEPVHDSVAPMPGETPGIPPWQKTVPEARPARFWILSAVALLSVGSLTALILTRRDPGPPLIPTPLTTYSGAEGAPSFSPDGKRVAFYWDGEDDSANVDIYIADTSSSSARRLTTSPERETNPAWSPDGSLIAFVRDIAPGSSDIWLTTALGENQRRLTGLGLAAPNVRLAWTKDSRWILAPDRVGGQASGIYAIHIVTGERRRVTQPPSGLAGDLAPAISPDGGQLAFTRDTAREWRDIFVAPLNEDLSAGPPRRLTSMPVRVDSLAWTPTGNEIVFGGATPSGGATYLYRVPLSGGVMHDLAGVRIEGNSPAISSQGALAFSKLRLEPTTIQSVELKTGTHGNSPRVRTILASSSRDYSVDFSGDGLQVVMSSIRTGSPQLWVFPFPGGTPKQLTFLDESGASVPRWSYDGRWIAFVSRSEGVGDISLVSPVSGQLRQLVQTPVAEARPSWSRDNRAVYFSQLQSGTWQIHRQPIDGGPPVQVTRRGGAFAAESEDQKWLYITSSDDSAEIRRMPLAGGPEETVASGALGRSALAVSKTGIFYLGAPSPAGITTLYFRPHDEPVSRPLLSITKPVHNAIALSPDERSLIFTQSERVQADLMFVSHFR